MPERRDLSKAELDVMEVLWRKGNATVKEVQTDLGKDRKLAYTTVATLLNRLRGKGYVGAVEKNFAYEFRPLAQRDQVLRRKLDDLVNQVLRGDVSPLAAYIAENRKLTPEQIAALEAMIASTPEKEDR